MNGSSNGNAPTEASQKRRKRRWGDAATASSAAPSNDVESSASSLTPAAIPAPAAAATTTTGGAPHLDSKAKALALQESVRARLAALKAKTAATAASSAAPTSIARATAKQPPPPEATVTAALASNNSTVTAASSSLKRPPPQSTESESAQQKSKRAKHYELDLSVTGPTFQQTKKKAKAINPYLAHKSSTKDETAQAEKEETLDERLIRSSKPRKRHKEINFIEPGTFVEIGERKRLKAANAERSGFLSGRKAGNFVQSSNMASIYGGGLEAEDELVMAPRPEASEKTTMPNVMEWWDVELLPSKLKKHVSAYEGKALSKQAQSQMQQLGSSSALVVDSEELRDLQTRCFDQASLSYSKTAALIQHIVPIKPPNAKDGPEAQPTLYLTKRELKRQRKLRRQEKQRELQDMQAAGLAPPPEARLTLKNFIKVLGDQAFLDPSQMEHKVVEQIEARQRAHLERNEANKLTKEQSSAKRAKKLQEDTSAGVHVALFYVKDMSHPYHRTKVDLNAQQYNITGGVLECDVPRLSCVICEGGPKAIKRYQRLMLVRMKWTGPEQVDEDEEDDDEEGEGTTHKFNPDNKCELVWTGMAVKRFFKGFVFQSCEVSDQARKILRAKGVGHFWDQVLTHASGRGDHFQLKLADDEDSEEEDDSEVGYGDMEEDEKEDAMEEDEGDGVAAVAYAQQG